MKDGLDEVLVHDLGPALKQPLLEVEDGELLHLLALVVEGLHDAEEERPAAAHLQVVLLKENIAKPRQLSRFIFSIIINICFFRDLNINIETDFIGPFFFQK